MFQYSSTNSDTIKCLNEVNNLQLQYNDTVNSYIDIDSLEKELDDLNKTLNTNNIQLEQLINKINSIKEHNITLQKQIDKLKTQINQGNLTNKNLEHKSNLLKNQYKDKNKEYKKLLLQDYRNSLYNINKNNSIIRRLKSTTKTTPIMDDFFNSEKDFLIFPNKFRNENIKVDLIITRGYYNIPYKMGFEPTMTELKQVESVYYEGCDRLKPLLNEIVNIIGDTKSVKKEITVPFDIPFPLGWIF